MVYKCLLTNKDKRSKMKTVVLKTLSNSGYKCKTYVIDCENALIFRKYTLRPDKVFSSPTGGEQIIKETDNYILSFHWFSIKKSTLKTSLEELGILRKCPTSSNHS